MGAGELAFRLAEVASRFEDASNALLGGDFELYKSKYAAALRTLDDYKDAAYTASL